MQSDSARVVGSGRSCVDRHNSHDASLDYVRLGGSRSLAIQPIRGIIFHDESEKSIWSSSLTVGKAATGVEWSQLNISDDQNRSLRDGNTVRCLGGRSSFGKLGGSAKSCQIDRVDLWRGYGSGERVDACQGGGWSA